MDAVRISLTFLDVLPITTFETTNIPIQAKKMSIQCVSEKPNGIMLKIGNSKQWTKHKLALEIPKISKTIIDCFFILFEF